MTAFYLITKTVAINI